jgi:hypothetical protein
VTRWEVWRQDDNGNQFRIESVADRVAALARVLAFESGPVHKQTYWVQGPSTPACGTNRELYRRVVDEGERMTAAGRSLEEFLRAWWTVGRALPVEGPFDLDTVAAMIAAAAMVEPPPLSVTVRSASFRYVEEPATRADWEAIVLSQIVDLADFADHGSLDELAYFGVDAPRPEGCERATGGRWYNFDPRGYLECGMAGSLVHPQRADRLDRAGAGLRGTGCPPGQGSLGGGDRVDRVGLALHPAGPPIGAVHLDQVDPLGGQIAGQAGTVGSGAFHPDLGHPAEQPQPGQQGLVPDRRSRELLITKDSADLVDHRRVVSPAVRIHSTRDQTLLGCHADGVVPFAGISNRVGTHPPGGRTGQ